jgi:Sulfotransferase family
MKSATATTEQPFFDPDRLMEHASRVTGLTDFGDDPLRDGLAVLCRALKTEARLNEAGARIAFDDIVTTLQERLKIEDWYARVPEIGHSRVAAPIMVIGLPRSGTSALSQMLAQDPANRSIRRWEAARPTPPPDITTESTDPRLIEMQRMLDRRYAASPEMMAMNPITADDPTENECFLKFTFRSLALSGVYEIPSYREWALHCDMRPAYRYLVRALKLLQWRWPPTRWNLKAPIDLFHLDAIADALPDARLVWTHRDPAKAVPSVASLLVARRRPMTDVIDKLALGRSECALWAEAIRRGMAYRTRSGSLPIVDLFNDDLVRDPVGTLSALYGRLGLEFSREFETALRRRMVDRPKGKFGQHRFTAEEFGLSEGGLKAAFDSYASRFGLGQDDSGNREI